MLTCPFLFLTIDLLTFWQIKNIDGKLSFDMEETLKKELNSAAAVKLMEKAVPVESNSNTEMCAIVASGEQAKVEVGSFYIGLLA